MLTCNINVWYNVCKEKFFDIVNVAEMDVVQSEEVKNVLDTAHYLYLLVQSIVT